MTRHCLEWEKNKNLHSRRIKTLQMHSNNEGQTSPIFNYLLLKLASRCNLGCAYCYWFRDKTVYEKPAILTADVEESLIQKLDYHMAKYNLKKFTILFHGGEPLLFGKNRFIKFMERLESVSHNTGCKLDLAITTNGVLIDKEWARLFRNYTVTPTISIDGPREIHDMQRPDLGNHGTYDRYIARIGNS